MQAFAMMVIEQLSILQPSGKIPCDIFQEWRLYLVYLGCELGFVDLLPDDVLFPLLALVNPPGIH